MVWSAPREIEISNILNQIKTIAIVGISANPERASNAVAKYLLASTDYEIYFVNPTIDEVFGSPVYPTLADLPVQIDLVDVFRNSSELPQVFKQAQSINPKVIWTQLGLVNRELAESASSTGLQVVMDKCLKIEHEKRATKLLGRSFP
ncbi:MAG: CoA-binding protein [Actinomycetes bacterium]